VWYGRTRPEIKDPASTGLRFNLWAQRIISRRKQARAWLLVIPPTPPFNISPQRTDPCFDCCEQLAPAHPLPIDHRKGVKLKNGLRQRSRFNTLSISANLRLTDSIAV